jgi:hypothetical protein
MLQKDTKIQVGWDSLLSITVWLGDIGLVPEIPRTLIFLQNNKTVASCLT